MKITVQKNEFYNKLKMVGKVVGSSKTMPQVENFLFVIGTDFIVTGSDISGIISGKVSTVAIENPKGATIKLLVEKTIMNALKELPEQPIEITIDERTLRITVSYKNGNKDGDGVFTIQGKDAAAFPEMKIDDERTEVRIEKSVLIEGFRSVMSFVANDELRPVMGGICFESKTDNLVFVATNSHILSLREYPVSEYPEFSSIVPAKAAKLITDILSESKEEEIQVSISNKNISVNTENYSMTYRQVEGRYPAYRNVIPKTHNTSVKVSSEEIQAVIRRVSVFANSSSHLLIMNVNSGNLQVNAEDVDYSVSANETLSAEVVGNPLKIGLHAGNMNEVLGSCTSDDCTIELIDASKAAIIRPVGIDGVTLLIMPMLINN